MSGPGLHSPVGGSAAKRLLICAPSVAFAEGIEDEESEHAPVGTAVHLLIETCLNSNTDGWEHIGWAPGPVVTEHRTGKQTPVVIDRDKAMAAQTMLDAVRAAHPDRNQGNTWIERHFRCPSIHPLYFSTSDVVHLDESDLRVEGDPLMWRTLHIWDYKNGAGVVIEVEDNDQGKHYGCGILEDLSMWDTVDEVVIHIVQPNAFHPDGPVREWRTTPNALAAWLEDVMVPGIVRSLAMKNGTLEIRLEDVVSGEHCRFCPARSHACPRLMADMEELQMLIQIVGAAGEKCAELSPDQLVRLLELTKTQAPIVKKAAEATGFRRLQAGVKLPGWKLVSAKADRVWKAEAAAEAAKAFAEQALTKPELKSPAQIEKLPGGTDFAARWAEKPDAGLNMAPASDKRPEVSHDTKALFTDVTKIAQPNLPVPEERDSSTPVVAKRRGGTAKAVEAAA